MTAEGDLVRDDAPAGNGVHLAVGYIASTRELLASIVRHRRLLWALAKRDISDDYVQHQFSLFWALIMPLFTVAVYVFIFTKIFPARIAAPEGHDTDSIVYLFSGIIPWLTLNFAVGRGMNSIVNNSNIVKQMAFPLELLPAKTLVSPFIFLGVALSYVVVYAGWITKGTILPFYLIGVPLALLITFATTLSLAVLFSSLQVFMRDTKEFVAMFFSLGLFLHPILYAPGAVPEAVRGAVYASPITYYIFCWQDALFYGGFERPWAWAAASGFAAISLVLSSRVFMASKLHFGEFV